MVVRECGAMMMGTEKPEKLGETLYSPRNAYKANEG
jgi:hypothetical protein